MPDSSVAPHGTADSPVDQVPYLTGQIIDLVAELDAERELRAVCLELLHHARKEAARLRRELGRYTAVQKGRAA